MAGSTASHTSRWTTVSAPSRAQGSAAGQANASADQQSMYPAVSSPPRDGAGQGATQPSRAQEEIPPLPSSFPEVDKLREKLTRMEESDLVRRKENQELKDEVAR